MSSFHISVVSRTRTRISRSKIQDPKMRDIDYFSKDNMKKLDHLDFVDSLPLRLATLVVNAEESDVITYGIDDVLQVHETHSFSNGIERITCGWNTTPIINVVPVVGWIAFGISRINQCPTISLYFNTATGKMLDEAAAQNELRALNFKEEGNKLFNADKFDEAVQKFESARNTSNVAHDKSKYESLVEQARTEATAARSAKSGQTFLADGDFASSEHDISSAFLMTCSEKLKDEYRKMLDGVRIEKTAASEKQIGDKAFEICDYEIAKEKYTNAYLTSQNQDKQTFYQSLLTKVNHEINVDKMKKIANQAFTGNDLQKAMELFEDTIRKSEHETHKQKLEEMKLIVVNEIEAVSHVEQARQLFAQSDFKKANEGVINALNKSTLESKRVQYQSFLKHVNVELKAFHEKETGDAAYESGDYHYAKQKYANAWLSTKLPKQNKIYKLQLDSANTEIQAQQIQKKAIEAFHAGAFEQAASLFNSALDVTKHQMHQRSIRQQLDRVRNEIVINEIKEDADRSFTNRNYKIAFEKYQEINQKTVRDDMLSESSALRQKCEHEIQAQNLKKRGDELFNQKNFDGAVQKFNEALEKSNLDVEKSIYSALVTEAESGKEEKLGDAALIDGDVVSALSHYEKALILTKLSSNKAKLSDVLKKIGLLGVAISNKKLQSGKAAESQLSSKLLEQSKLFEQGIQLIEKGKSKKAVDKEQQALNNYQDAGGFLCSGLNLGNNVFFNEFKRLVLELQHLGANNEASELVERFCASYREGADRDADQIDSIQAMLDDNKGAAAAVNYSARNEKKQENKRQKVVGQLQYDKNC